ncbi:Hypothetical predicted protein [Paramuricea clavata]|uniref:Uncharacterized protein n=1 Tax=Paramuricea clavata TaxID=317549 RepID=A0A6S7H155_PARCT|nr:Hypothetical predicted protein [Paramuricea clavata]
MEEEPAVPPSKPKMPFLRSKVPKMSQQPHTILPKLCIICKKLTKRTKIKGKWVHESLSKAETSDAGQLRSAAERIDDETILKDIRGKDCSCIEVQYHKSCYNDYVRVLKGNDSVGEKKTNFFSEHKAGYDAFCKIVIKERLEVNCEILRLTKLQQLLLKHIQLEERVHLENIRSDMLRVRLQRDFEQLVFHIPSRRNESTIVYCQNVTAGDIAQQYLPTSQVSSVEDESDENQNLPPCKDALLQHIKRCSYQAAIHQRAIQQTIDAPSPDGYGWSVKDGVIDVVWKTKPAAPECLLKTCAGARNGKDDNETEVPDDSSQISAVEDDLDLPPFSI